MEEWKVIIIDGKKFNYEVSNLGRVRNTKRLNWKTKGLLTPKKNKQNGYSQVKVVLNGDNYYQYIHRLVAEAFIPNTLLLPQVNHKDGDKHNNNKGNLEWTTPEGNMKHAFDNILVEGTQKPVSVYSLKGDFIGEYVSISEAIRTLFPSDIDRTLGLNEGVLDNPKLQMYGVQWRLIGSDVPVHNIERKCHRTQSVNKLTLDGDFIRDYPSVAEACRDLGVRNNGDINRVCLRKQKSSHGFKWQYKGESQEN